MELKEFLRVEEDYYHLDADDGFKKPTYSTDLEELLFHYVECPEDFPGQKDLFENVLKAIAELIERFGITDPLTKVMDRGECIYIKFGVKNGNGRIAGSLWGNYKL